MQELTRYLTKNHPVSSSKTSPTSSSSTTIRRPSGPLDSNAEKLNESKESLSKPSVSQFDRSRATLSALKVSVGGDAGGVGSNDKWPWKCKRCGFIHQNVSRVKRHIVCYHMKLKPFSCPYCSTYIWKMQVSTTIIDTAISALRQTKLSCVGYIGQEKECLPYRNLNTVGIMNNENLKRVGVDESCRHI